MTQHIHEGTPQQLAEWFVHLPKDKRYRVLVEEEPETEKGTVSFLQGTPNQETIDASRDIPDYQEGQRPLGSSRIDPLVRQALEGTAQTKRDLDLVARVKSIQGKYARTDGTSGSGELQQERQRDRAGEEAKIKGLQP